MGTTGRVAASVALLLVVGVTAGCEPGPPPVTETPLGALVGEPGPDSELVGCDRAGDAVVVTGDSHLDPACTYTRGITVTGSGTTFDCRGARIEDTTGTQGRGITVSTPVGTPLSDVTVRNCVIAGFLNNVRVTRDGFRVLPAGDESEYADGTSDIVVENSHLYRSRGSGVFVDGFVAGVTLRDLDISGSGGVGIYLEAGSRDNVVERNTVHRNGWDDVYGEGVPFVLAGHEFRYHSTGREGLAIDGSRGNVVRDNTFALNANGGILLYKNCGEFATERPEQWWTRPYGADGNLIEGNTFLAERYGVWVGSRMAENQYFMDCSDDAYVDEGVTRFHVDRAQGNTVRDNAFDHVTYGVRVEDDGTTVAANTFVLGAPGDRAVVVGTRERAARLGRPTAGTVVTGNAVTSPAGAPAAGPFVTIPGEQGTSASGNRLDGAPVGFAPGSQPPQDPWLMVREVWDPSVGGP